MSKRLVTKKIKKTRARERSGNTLIDGKINEIKNINVSESSSISELINLYDKVNELINKFDNKEISLGNAISKAKIKSIKELWVDYISNKLIDIEKYIASNVDFLFSFNQSLDCYIEIEKIEDDLKSIKKGSKNSTEINEIKKIYNIMYEFKKRAYLFLTEEELALKSSNNAGNKKLKELYNELKKEKMKIVWLLRLERERKKRNLHSPIELNSLHFEKNNVMDILIFKQHRFTNSNLLDKIGKIHPFCSDYNKEDYKNCLNIYNEINAIIQTYIKTSDDANSSARNQTNFEKYGTNLLH